MAPIIPPPPVSGVRARQLRRHAAAMEEHARYEMPLSDEEEDPMEEDDEIESEWEEYNPEVFERQQQAGSSSAAPRNDADDEGWIRAIRSRDELPRDDTPHTPTTTRALVAPGAPRAQRPLVRYRQDDDVVAEAPPARRRRLTPLADRLEELSNSILNMWARHWSEERIDDIEMLNHMRDNYLHDADNFFFANMLIVVRSTRGYTPRERAAFMADVGALMRIAEHGDERDDQLVGTVLRDVMRRALLCWRDELIADITRMFTGV